MSIAIKIIARTAIAQGFTESAMARRVILPKVNVSESNLTSSEFF